MIDVGYNSKEKIKELTEEMINSENIVIDDTFEVPEQYKTFDKYLLSPLYGNHQYIHNMYEEEPMEAAKDNTTVIEEADNEEGSSEDQDEEQFGLDLE